VSDIPKSSDNSFRVIIYLFHFNASWEFRTNSAYPRVPNYSTRRYLADSSIASRVARKYIVRRCTRRSIRKYPPSLKRCLCSPSRALTFRVHGRVQCTTQSRFFSKQSKVKRWVARRSDMNEINGQKYKIIIRTSNISSIYKIIFFTREQKRACCLYGRSNLI